MHPRIKEILGFLEKMNRKTPESNQPERARQRMSDGMIKILPVVGASPKEIARVQLPSDEDLVNNLLDPKIYGERAERRSKPNRRGSFKGRPS